MILIFVLTLTLSNWKYLRKRPPQHSVSIAFVFTIQVNPAKGENSSFGMPMPGEEDDGKSSWYGCETLDGKQ